MKAIFGSVRIAFASAPLVLLGLLSACTSTTEPPVIQRHLVTLDPRDVGTIVIEAAVTIELADGSRVHVDLIGTDLEVDPEAETVSLDVALRNRSRLVLGAPALVLAGDFDPASVEIINADDITASGQFVLDYSDLLGPDGVLGGGETSEPRTWVFRDPGLVPFAFATSAEFGTDPEPPLIAGVLFLDGNRNGVFDPDESVFETGGVVIVTGPELETRVPVRGGRYALPVRRPGLYTLTASVPLLASDIPDDAPVALLTCFTTPNPLQVVLTAGPDGQPQSYEEAHFGLIPGPCHQPPDLLPVVLTDAPPDSIGPRDPYTLIDAALNRRILTLDVGFSGCSPDHPFTFYVSTNVMESLPPQVWALLSHDARGELCLAFFRRKLHFDLTPVLGLLDPPQPIVVRFMDHEGNEHRFLIEPPSGLPDHEATD